MGKIKNNSKLNIAELLKTEPEGLSLWSPILGDIKFDCVDNIKIYVTAADNVRYTFYSSGLFMAGYYNSECTLFPSRDHRTWEDWEEYKKSVKVKDDDDDLYPVEHDDITDALLEDPTEWEQYTNISYEVAHLHAAYWVWKKQDSEARKDDTTLVIKLRDGALELHYQCKDSETPFLSFNSRKLATKFMQTFEPQLKTFFNIK